MEDGENTTTSLLLCMGETLTKYEREVDDARDAMFLSYDQGGMVDRYAIAALSYRDLPRQAHRVSLDVPVHVTKLLERNASNKRPSPDCFTGCTILHHSIPFI
ncbi:hypothetical protein F442_21899 [Phytophthora nicotianae P10297]|uniref:Uncharacterized protein n=1 Tax=Phytophthora nicotianae P10297 TaxID=1317064 RepID=W2Y171_PHYNI|nr:hypothetical protein F442_21899 [Phytophthora nicotianae P10297]